MTGNDRLPHALPVSDVLSTRAPGWDFYRVDLAGRWRFDLYQSLLTRLDPPAYDFDLRLWRDAMERIRGSSAVGDHDWVDHAGPAYLEVYGPRGTSGAYRVELVRR